MYVVTYREDLLLVYRLTVICYIAPLLKVSTKKLVVIYIYIYIYIYCMYIPIKDLKQTHDRSYLKNSKLSKTCIRVFP